MDAFGVHFRGTTPVTLVPAARDPSPYPREVSTSMPARLQTVCLERSGAGQELRVGEASSMAQGEMSHCDVAGVSKSLVRGNSSAAHRRGMKAESDNLVQSPEGRLDWAPPVARTSVNRWVETQLPVPPWAMTWPVPSRVLS